MSKVVASTHRRYWSILSAVSIATGATIFAVAWIYPLPTFLIWLSFAAWIGPLLAGQGWRRDALTYLTAVAALGIAFSWAPSAMADAVDGSWWVGLLICTPILLFDAMRIAVPVIFARRIAVALPYRLLAAAAGSGLIESLVSSCFPWRLGYVQMDDPRWLQGAAWIGPSYYTLTLWLHAAIPILLVAFTLDRAGGSQSADRGSPRIAFPLVSGIVATAVLIDSLSLWRHHNIASDSRAPVCRMLLTQCDVSYSSSIETLQAMGNKADAVDLVCWPESAIGTYQIDWTDLSDSAKLYDQSISPYRGLRVWPQPTAPYLTGAKVFTGNADQPGQTFVAGLLINREEQIVARYLKRELMPFGEYLPQRQLFEWLEWFGDLEDASAGTEATVLCDGDKFALGVLMCYEDMIPYASRDSVLAGADLLVCLINGSAFQNQTTLHQHRLLGHGRAIELGRSLVRCAATGESCIISANGDLLTRLPMQVDAHALYPVPRRTELTFYARTGPWPINSVMAMILLALLRRKSTKPLADQEVEL